MAIEGELVVRVETHAGRVTRARARPQRPRVAGPLFSGRRASEAAPLAGALFAICGRSQEIAAAAAVESARDGDEDRALGRSRDARIAAETAHEHAWRLLVDWPRLANRAPAVEALAAGRKALAPLLSGEEGIDVREAAKAARAWSEQAIFGMAPARFLEMDGVAALLHWAAGQATTVAALAGEVLVQAAPLGSSDVDFLPAGGADWIASGLGPSIDEDGFDEVPHWQGEPRETGPLARRAAHPLVAGALQAWGRGVGARLAARLVEMAEAVESLSRGEGSRHGTLRLGESSALSWAETARGLLVHRVALDGERIAGYRIVAPTEWNFHPDGAFSRGALDLAAGDPGRLERDLRWLVASLDPCVAVRFEAGHA